MSTLRAALPGRETRSGELPLSPSVACKTLERVADSQVEKKHSHDPHPGVTGQLEYDHPVSYAVAVAKKHAEEAAAPALQLRDGRA